MANQLINDLSQSISIAADSDVLVIGNSTTHKKMTYANFKAPFVQNSQRQEVLFADINLSQSQMQNLFATPITLDAAPGAEYYFQITGASAFLDHNGTDYTATSPHIELIVGGLQWRVLNIIDRSTDTTTSAIFTSGANISHNTALTIKAASIVTGNGGTMHVFVQYMKIYTGILV